MMIKNIFILLFTLSPLVCQSQGVTGKWKTIDDDTGKPKAIVEIYKKDNKFYGKIVKLFRRPEQNPDPICEECPENDPRYGKKIIGMEIIKDLKKIGHEYTNGTILKPDEGKIYKCKLWLEDDKLNIRGYWGFFYRTQEWVRSE